MVDATLTVLILAFLIIPMGLLPIPLALVVPWVIWGLLMGLFLSVLLAARDGIIQLRRLHQVPCNRCRYHTGSHHLRCPVQPYRAFSDAAIHCPDFCPCPRPTLKQQWQGWIQTVRHRIQSSQKHARPQSLPPIATASNRR